ncbi:MAG: DUF2516 family protein [Propionibacteriales bacterium]|nr:DUF2516 family protein [Propionibacteriales bacterium]
MDSWVGRTIEQPIYLAIWGILLLVKLFALCDAALRPNQLYAAAGKQTKILWLAMLGVTLLLQVFSYDLFLMMIGAVVALVYLADVRPVLRSMQRR